eukprot:312671-Chlamydomonas_euryale.AAC.3
MGGGGAEGSVIGRGGRECLRSVSLLATLRVTGASSVGGKEQLAKSPKLVCGVGRRPAQVTRTHFSDQNIDQAVAVPPHNLE